MMWVVSSSPCLQQLISSTVHVDQTPVHHVIHRICMFSHILWINCHQEFRRMLATRKTSDEVFLTQCCSTLRGAAPALPGAAQEEVTPYLIVR